MKDYVEVVFILDESGSMHSLTSDTIGGFNAMIAKQKESEGDALVTAVSFNNIHRTFIDREDVRDVFELTKRDYRPGGTTALMDAMGDTIHHIEEIHKYIRKEDLPKKTVFFITTDGKENSSYKYSSDEIKSMVEEKTEKDGWEFVFMAANIDAVETAKSYGIRKERAIDYKASKAGTKAVYASMADAFMMMKMRPDMACEELDDLKNKIQNGNKKN